jgi:hypothetical protein
MLNQTSQTIVQRDHSVKVLIIKDGLEHRVVKFTKQKLWWSLLAVPGGILLLIVFLALFSIYSWFQLQEKSSIDVQEVAELKKQNLFLQNEVGSLKNGLTEINNKLLIPTKEQNPLSLFITSQGFQNLTDENKVLVENLSYIPLDNNTYRIKFELHNQSGEEKSRGHFFVISHAGNQMFVYPNSINLSKGPLAFTDGEPFNVGRFKIIEFESKFLKQGQVILRIIIFSRTGDLLYNKMLSLD